MKSLFGRVFRIFSREFRALPVADPAAPFLRLTIYAWGAMFPLVYAVLFAFLGIKIFVLGIEGPGRYGHPLVYQGLCAVCVCAGLVVLLPVFGAWRHWRAGSSCARALRAVALHQIVCLGCLAPAVLLALLNEGYFDGGLSFLEACLFLLLPLFAPQLLHWYSFGIFFVPGLILLVACYAAGGGALPGWRLPALAVFLAAASASSTWALYRFG